MKKYIVNDRGVEWSYNDKDKAEKKATELNAKVIEKTVWRYYAPYYSSGLANYREITGKSLPVAIEEGFERIIKEYDLGYAAGVKIVTAKLVKCNGYANLSIKYIPYGKFKEELPEKEQVVKIEWVTDEEFAGEYDFEILR